MSDVERYDPLLAFGAAVEGGGILVLLVGLSVPDRGLVNTAIGIEVAVIALVVAVWVVGAYSWDVPQPREVRR